MTDDEYKELLSALARKHLRPHSVHVKDLHATIEQLSAAARLNRVLEDNPESFELANALSYKLRETPAKRVVDLMEDSGMVAALDDVPELVFRNLRRSVIPNEDIEMLREAGVRNPEEELTIAVYAARHLHFEQTPRAGLILREAPAALQQAADKLANAPNDPPKKRKICNGIGRILGGLIGGAGNTLLAIGTIVGPNPATAYLAIGSAAAAVPLIFQGIGDLRGE